MSNQITTAFVEQFSNNLLMLAQQKGSRLRGAVMNKQVVGDAAYFERIGPTDVLAITTRHGDSPQVDSEHSRRRVTLAGYDWGDLIDQQDEVQMLIDPKSAYAQNAAFAMGRQIDRLIIAAATGNAVAVSSSLSATTTNVALPAGQIIDDDFGTTNSNLTIPKLIEAKRIFMANDIDDSEELVLVANASAIASLLNTTQVTSADFNTVKALVRGDIDTFLGFKFLRTELLAGTADGTDTDPKLMLAFAKSGIGLATGMDIKVQIAERPDKRFSTYVYAQMRMGAVRIEDTKVVAIQCVQAA